MSTTTSNHIGRKISRIRELRGMKQETLAEAMGISQQSISQIEQSENVDEERLEKVAKALGVTKEGIENFSEENVVNFFNNFNDNSANNGAFYASHCTFNPLEKFIEAIEENKKLYERLLKAEQEKISYLEKLVGKK